MESPKSSNNETAVAVPKYRKANSKGKAHADADAPPPPAVIATAKATPPPQAKWKKGVAILDFIVRLGAIGATFAATSTMGTTDQRLPFFTQFLQFHAQYNNFSVFTGFVIATAAASGYLVLSLPFSIVCIIRPHATGPRLFLAIFDTVMVAVTIGAAAAAQAIVYLANNGNSYANWNPICQQFDEFCQSTSTAVMASFVAAVLFIFLVAFSAVALKNNFTK